MSLNIMIKSGIEIFISFSDIRENVESYIFLVSPLENRCQVGRNAQFHSSHKVSIFSTSKARLAMKFSPIFHLCLTTLHAKSYLGRWAELGEIHQNLSERDQ